jgi:hypothetical protein
MSKTGYQILRDTVSSADSDMTATTKTWANFVTNYKVRTDSHTGAVSNGGKSIKVPPYGNVAVIVFDHKNANTDTADFKIYGFANGGDAEFICLGQLTAGAQGTNDSTQRFYADTVDDTAGGGGNDDAVTERHIGSVAVYDGNGNDGVARVVFDTYDFEYLLCLFTAISTSDDVRAKVRFTKRY